MQIDFYLTDKERDGLIDFIRSQESVFVLGFRPGDPEGLDEDSIMRNRTRYISLWPIEDVAVSKVETDAGFSEVYNTTVTPLIAWDIPYQKGKIIVGGRLYLVKWQDMEPGGKYRSDFLRSKKLLTSVKNFLEQRFVKIDNDLFNGQQAIEMFNNGYEGLPFDPEKTTFHVSIND